MKERALQDSTEEAELWLRDRQPIGHLGKDFRNLSVQKLVLEASLEKFSLDVLVVPSAAGIHHLKLLAYIPKLIPSRMATVVVKHQAKNITQCSIQL